MQLVSATEGTNARARGIQFVVAEDYSRQLAQRTRDGLLKRFEQGAFTGGVASYGYRVVNGEDGRRVLAVDPAEAAIVREIAGWYLNEQVGFKTIAKRLRARQIASRRGKGWSFTSVRALLNNPILAGWVRFNVRRMHLDRRTGRRVPRQKAEAEHLERHDESLRILYDQTFAKIEDRLDQGARGEKPKAPSGIAPFSGLVFCGCGAKCYRVTSENKKGRYHYYVCSRHLRYEDCPTKGRVREDALPSEVDSRVQRVLSREDEIIAGIVEFAREASKGNRDEAVRIKGDIAAAEKEQARLVELLMNQDIGDAAKAVISRKLAEIESKRADLLAAVDGLHDEANNNTDLIAKLARQVFEDLRDGLQRVATPEELNRFFEQFVGPMVAGTDGSVAQKKPPAALATGGVLIPRKSHLQGVVAGGGFEPPTSGL